MDAVVRPFARLSGLPSGGVRLSVLLCVRNEEARIAPLLRALAFADEVIVVADRSTDQTVAIASRLGAVVIEGSWPLEGDRKRAGLDVALGDWIFELDADEMPDGALAAAIAAAVAAPDGPDWHQVPIANHVAGRHIRRGWGGSFGTSSAARLYRRGVKIWGPQRVHPRVRLAGRQGPPLAGSLRHDVDEGVSDMLARLDRYTRLHAYVRRGGWREGQWGFLIALMAALYPLLSMLRANLEPGEG